MDNRPVIILLFFWLTGLSLSDIRYRKVPVWMILLGGVAIVGIGVYGCVRNENGILPFFIGMVPGTALILLAVGTQKAGCADGIVLMLLGCILGFRECILTAILSLVMISALSAVLLILKKADIRTRIPYIPFLTIGFVICISGGG